MDVNNNLPPVFLITGMFLMTGCVTTYHDADQDLEAVGLMGQRFELTQSARLPIARWHLIKVWYTENYDCPGTVEIQEGTILRVDHFERRVGMNAPTVITAQARAQNGPQKGARIVIGKIS